MWHAQTRTHTSTEGPHTAHVSHTHPKSGNFSPRSLFRWHFDLLMTSFFPGLFSSSTRASATSFTVRNNKGLFIQGNLAAGSVGRQKKRMMHLSHRSKAQFRCAEPTGLKRTPKGHGQWAGCLPESTAKAQDRKHPVGCLRLGNTLHMQDTECED